MLHASHAPRSFPILWWLGVVSLSPIYQIQSTCRYGQSKNSSTTSQNTYSAHLYGRPNKRHTPRQCQDGNAQTSLQSCPREEKPAPTIQQVDAMPIPKATSLQVLLALRCGSCRLNMSGALACSAAMGVQLVPLTADGSHNQSRIRWQE